MDPKWHILFGFVVSYILIYFFDFSLISAIIIFLSSFLIDVDHYFLYVHETKKLSLFGAYSWCVEEGKKFGKLSETEKGDYMSPILVFHGIEFVFILVLLSFFHLFFFYVLLGVLIHLSVDIPHLYFQRRSFSSKISQIYIHQTNKRKKSSDLLFS